MNFIGLLLLLIIRHPYIAGFIASILEEATVFLAILSGRGLIPLYVVAITGFIGILVVDSLWYLLGRSNIAKTIKEHKVIDFLFGSLLAKAEKLSKEKYSTIGVIALTKFVYGTRIVTILSLAVHKIKYAKFIIYDAIAVFLWIAVILPLAWLAGKGFTRLLNVARGVEKILAILLLTIIGLYILNKVLKYLLRNKI